MHAYYASIEFAFPYDLQEILLEPNNGKTDRLCDMQPFFRFLAWFLLEEEVNNKKFKRLSFEVCSAADCTITSAVLSW